MLTYIWNSEYEVFIASADSEWQAREKIKTKMGLDLLSYLLENNPTDEQKEARSRDKMRDIEEGLQALNTKASYILKEGEALIYDHGNE